MMAIHDVTKMTETENAHEALSPWQKDIIVKEIRFPQEEGSMHMNRWITERNMLTLQSVMLTLVFPLV